MGNDLFSYLARMEIMVFFVGYAIIYAFVFFLAGEFQKKPVSFIKLLPTRVVQAYALCGTLFFGYMIKKIYIGYGMNVPVSQLYHPLLVIWGLGAMLFWLKPLQKFPVLSLLHSLVYFYFIPRDIFLKYSGAGENDMVKNDMSILTVSLLLNISCLAVVLIFHYGISYWQKFRKSAINDEKSS
jgi:hypothetical protein